jgi:hypothetical protein
MMIPAAFDLFGEIPVTLDDLNTWCDHLGKSWTCEWRKEWYIQNWNVAAKVQRTKLDGSFWTFSDRSSSILAVGYRVALP